MEVHKHTRYESTYHEHCVTTFQIGVKIVILEYKSEKEYSLLMEITSKLTGNVECENFSVPLKTLLDKDNTWRYG